ncbi:MAG: 30S ribosomal protein S17 [Dehalococcoidia bacterium]|jgi:small subunit ribosomal protein S17|nr:30S ribosomal protein S17 [Dehalococcoidia bacterium]
MRKVRTGSVVRTPRGQTAVVEMVWKQRNRLYRKQVRRVARFHVHDALNQCRLGDVVRIEETRPISKTKRWRLMEILERRQVAEVRAIDLESDAVVVTDEVDAEPEASEASEAGEDEVEGQESVTDSQGTEDSEE